jgi:2-methylisocitrate lyase-like PEP mutase family enzyme
MLEVVRRITRTVKIPVTADIEGGYAKGDKAAFSQFINGIIEAGAVGVNLEDRNAQTGKLNKITHQVGLIRRVKEICKQRGVNLFVNARTDAFMAVPGDLDTRRKIALERADAFEQAGADGIFVPFIRNMETVAFLKEHIHLPLNILMEESLDIAGLRKLKVNRVSTGSKPILATMSLLKKIAAALGSGDDWSPIFTNDTSYAEANKWYA